MFQQLLRPIPRILALAICFAASELYAQNASESEAPGDDTALVQEQDDQQIPPTIDPLTGEIIEGSTEASVSRREIAIGLVAGLNYNMFSGKLENALPESSLSILEGGSGFSGMFGVTIDLLPLKANGAQFRFAYENKAYTHTAQWTGEAMSPDGAPSTFTAESEHHFSLGHIAFAALLRFELVEKFSLLIGPTIQKSIGKTSGEIESRSINPPNFLTLPSNVDGENSRNAITSNPDQDFRWGLDAAIAYRTLLADDWILSAELGGQYFITYLHRNADDIPDYSRQRTDGVPRAQITEQILHSLQARIGLLYTL